MSKQNRSAGITLSYVYTFLNMILGLFMSSFLLRSLGDTSYGIYQTMSSFANYLVLLEFGTGTVMTRNLSICRSKNATELEIQKNVSTIWTITNVLGAVILTVSVIFYFSLDSVYAKSLTASQLAEGKSIFIAVTVFLLASFYVSTLNGVVLAYEKYTLNSKISIVKIIVRTALLVALITLVKKAIWIALVDAALGVAIALFLLLYSKKSFGIRFNFSNFDKIVFKSALPLCFAVFLQGIVNQANSNVGKFIIGIKLPPEVVSLYSVGLYVYSLFSSITTIPITMYAPQLTRDVTNGLRGKELTKQMIQPSRLIVLIGGSVLFGFISVGKQFISIIYGDKYLQAWLIAIIIMVPMFINMSNGIIINVLDAMNKRMSRSIVLIITTALNIVMTIFFVDWWGVIGVAVATAACTLIGHVILMNIYYMKAIKINVFYMFYKTYKGILVYQIVGAIVAYFVGQLISNVYVSFVVGGCLYVFVAFIGFFLFGKNKYEKELVSKVLNKIRRKNA